MGFLKQVLAVVTGFLLFLIIGFILLVAVLSSGGDKKDASINGSSVLKITLDNQIIERESDKLFDGILDPMGSSVSKIGLLQLREAIKDAASNSKIKGIVLDFKLPAAGIASWKELRDELVNFKKSGKFIIAYGEIYTEASYYIASVADEIYLPESGALEFNGMGVQMLYFKNLLNKIGVKTEVFRVGKFKSAVEPFTNDHMSDEDREQVKKYINSLHSVLLKDISDSRKISYAKLKTISDSMLVRNAADAKTYGLITHVAYYDELLSSLKTRLKLDSDQDVAFVSYKKLLSQKEEVKGRDSEKRIAVLFADGEIHSGKGEGESIGSETYINTLRKLREDKKVKAIVLRINSPGGSALASDLIWREIVLTKKVKPVIASMSDVAASGGYYIAMACDTIVASPASITGSIGVFGLLMNTEDLLNNKLGINTDRENTGLYSDIGSLTRPVTDAERGIIQNEVNNIYTTFLKKAAEGRHTSIQNIEQYASGRVWSGADAKSIKLIDVFGGMDEAIAIAIKKAKVSDNYELVYYPEQKNQELIQLINSIAGGDEEETSLKTFGEYYSYYKVLKSLPEKQGVQARLPYLMEIR
jgi:protease-4